MGRRFSVIMLFPLFLALSLEAQDRSIPDQVTRPQRGEEPRYALDTVIGELGQGAAPAAAWQAARNALAAMLRGNRDSALFAGFGQARLGELFSAVGGVEPEKYRIGGGRIMPDGSVSFLFRFAGRERGISGEIYLRQDRVEEDGERESPAPQGPWRLDDMLLDEVHDTTVRREHYPYDFTPYERFY